MSDHPKEAERNLKRIRICNDIYLDVFHWLAPAKVGLELALVSDKFDALVGTHLKGRKWTLGKLGIWPMFIVKINDDGSMKKLPFPQKQLPNSIVGFSSVYVYGSNSSYAIPFLRCIGRLLKSDVCLEFEVDSESNLNTFATSVWPLRNMSGIIKLNYKLHYDYPYGLQPLRRLISPSILRDCANLRVISFGIKNFLQFPPDDNKGSSDGQALCKWLHTPRADGEPKMLITRYEGDGVPIDALKTSFLNASTSVSFIIHLYSFTSVGPFNLFNSLTREQMTCQKIDNAKYWMIERSPIDKSAEQWTKRERKALEDGKNDWKVLGMGLCSWAEPDLWNLDSP